MVLSLLQENENGSARQDVFIRSKRRRQGGGPASGWVGVSGLGGCQHILKRLPTPFYTHVTVRIHLTPLALSPFSVLEPGSQSPQISLPWPKLVHVEDICRSERVAALGIAQAIRFWSFVAHFFLLGPVFSRFG